MIPMQLIQQPLLSTVSYARSGLTSINKMRIFRLVIGYESEVDRAGNALDMRSNLIVLGGRERSLRRALNGP